MRHLVYLMHADPSVRTLFDNAIRAEGLDADVVCVVRGAGSAAYTQLAYECRRGGRILPGLSQRYKPPRPLDRYDSVVGASWSAGYGFWRECLACAEDAAELDGIVGLDSWYAGWEADGTPRDSQLAALLSFALQAREGPKVCWLGHTDVPTYDYANTTACADELLRLADVKRDAQGVAKFGGLHVWPVDLFKDPHDEHVAALRQWGPEAVADALAALEPRLLAAGGRQDVAEEPGGQGTIPPGERALVVACGEQERGVREVRGSRHNSRILAYLAGCMRDGQRIGQWLQRDEIAWCAAFASWCGRQACMGREPHQWRAAVRELWSDGLANGAAVGIDRVRDGEVAVAVGDLAIMTRGGKPRDGAFDPFVATNGKGHVGRVRELGEGGAFKTIDGNVADAITDVRRNVADEHLVGFLLYPRPRLPRFVPHEPELEVARRLWKLHDDLKRGTDTDLATRIWDV